jgi:hypothetical protein
VAWSERTRPNRLRPACFDNVTPGQRREPSWLGKAKPGSAAKTADDIPPSPRLPTGVATDTRPSDIDRSASERARRLSASGTPLPGASLEQARPSMSPAELEALVAHRAASSTQNRVLQEAQQAIAAALAHLSSSSDRLSQQLEARAADLALLVARRVIARELRTQPDIVVDLVRQGLEVLNARDQVRVHLGPEFAVVREVLIQQLGAKGTSTDVIIDPSLPAYGCVVETDIGSVDESIESRFAMLTDTLDTEKGE